MADTLEQEVVDQPAESAPAVESTSKRRRKPTEDVAAADLADLTPPSSPAPVADSAPETSSPAAADAPADPFLQRLEQELGFTDLKDRTDAETRLVQFAAEQRREREQLEAWRRENEPLVGYGREYIANRPATQQQSPAAAELKPWQPPVEYPADAERRYLERDESGGVKFKDGTPAEARAQIERYVAYRDGLVEMFATRPDQFIEKVLIPLIDERSKGVIEPFYNERTAEQQAQSYYEQVAEENRDWLYAKDPRTNQPTQQLTERGKLFDQKIAYYAQFGMSPQEAVRLAKRDVDEQVAPPVKTTVAATTEQRRREHVNNARKPNGVPRNRIGSYPQPGERRPQNDNGGFGADFVDELNALVPAS